MSTITVTGTYTVPTGQTETLQASGDMTAGFFNLDASNATVSLQIDGALILSAENGAFLGITSGYALTTSLAISATGSLSIDEPDALYPFDGAYVGTFQNAGTYSVVAGSGAAAGFAVGVITWNDLTPVTNTGSFSVSGWNAIGIAAEEIAGSSGAFWNSGSISVYATQEAEAFNIGATHGGSIVNSGSIVATSGQGPATAIQIGGGGFGSVFSIFNSGTITATGTAGGAAIYVDNAESDGISGSTIYLNSGSPLLHLTNQGVVNGLIDLGFGPNSANASQDGGQIVNTGHINGAIYLSRTGAGLYDGRGGTQIGGIHLGGGTDTVYLGDDGEIAYAGDGSGTIVGGAGADFIVAGAGSSTLTGGGGADTFVYRAGDGNVTIADFSRAEGDKIDLSVPGILSLSNILDSASQVGPNTVIRIGSQTITLDNVAATNLQGSDFVFSPVKIVFGAVNIGAMDTVSLSAADGISATSGPLAQFTGQSGGTLVNHGSMTLATSSAGQFGIAAFDNPVVSTSPDSTAIFENDGGFSVTAPDPTGVAAVTTYNYGTFSVIGTSASSASTTWGTTRDVVNAGSMTIEGVGTTRGVYDFTGVQTGVFQNLSGANFTVTSTAGSAYGVGLFFGQHFENDGQIAVSGAASALGVEFAASSAGEPLINGGTITVIGPSSIGIQLGPRFRLYARLDLPDTEQQRNYNGSDCCAIHRIAGRRHREHRRDERRGRARQRGQYPGFPCGNNHWRRRAGLELKHRDPGPGSGRSIVRQRGFGRACVPGAWGSGAEHRRRHRHPDQRSQPDRFDVLRLSRRRRRQQRHRWRRRRE